MPRLMRPPDRPEPWRWSGAATKVPSSDAPHHDTAYAGLAIGLGHGGEAEAEMARQRTVRRQLRAGWQRAGADIVLECLQQSEIGRRPRSSDLGVQLISELLPAISVPATPSCLFIVSPTRCCVTGISPHGCWHHTYTTRQHEALHEWRQQGRFRIEPGRPARGPGESLPARRRPVSHGQSSIDCASHAVVRRWGSAFSAFPALNSAVAEPSTGKVKVGAEPPPAFSNICRIAARPKGRCRAGPCIW